MSKEDNNLLKKHLIDYGLSEKEASIYLALLEVETGTAQEISKKARINRSSTYVVLESLKRQGLAALSEDKKVQRYTATNPEIFLQTIDREMTRAQEMRKNISKIVPELRGLYKDTPYRPKVKVLDGKEGLMAAFEETLECEEKFMRVASSVENLVKILPDYFPGYVQRRIRAGIKMRGMHPNDDMAKMLIRTSDKLDEPILIPKEKYLFPADMAIYDNKIGYMSPENGGLAILIESKEVAQVMKTVFDMAWEEAKRLSKENSKGAKKRASGDTK